MEWEIVVLIVCILAFFSGGWACGVGSDATSCERIGAFYSGSKVYTCAPKDQK